MDNSNVFFGWRVVFQFYTLKNLLIDSIVPMLLSTIVVILSYMSHVASYDVLNKGLNLGMTVAPVMISLLIAAYAILLSMFCSNTGKAIAQQEGGTNLLDGLNADFATSILASFVGIIFFIMASFIHSLGFTCLYADFINYFALLIAAYLLFFSVYILKDLVIGIFNFGRVAAYFQD